MKYADKTPMKGLYSLAGAVLLAIAVAACTIKAEELPAVTSEVSNLIPVDAAVVKPGELTDDLSVTGTILANQQVQIVSELTRRITNVNVREGSHVKRGTVLFELDNADLLAQWERLRQQEKLATLNEKRLKDLVDHEAVAQQDYDEAETNLRVIQAQVLELKAMIDKTRIVAPFDGQIGMINTYRGAVVSVNTILTDIEDNSVVKVEFSVPEKYTNIISVGSEQAFTTPASSTVFKSTVIARGASLSTDTRSLLVRSLAKNPDGRLIPGQSARILLSLSTSKNALSVPSQALIPSPEGYVVYVVRKGAAQPLPVEIGQRGTGSIEVVKGLTAGDTIITSNHLRLAPGTPVHLASVK